MNTNQKRQECRREIIAVPTQAGYRTTGARRPLPGMYGRSPGGSCCPAAYLYGKSWSARRGAWLAVVDWRHRNRRGSEPQNVTLLSCKTFTWST
eukprot:scaffold912_cov422-Prasinococcus_capsulatus_cf.AAC.5